MSSSPSGTAPVRTTGWSPLLDGDLADRARSVADGIAAALREPQALADDPTFGPPHLAGGSPGGALLFAERHLVTGEQADADAAFGFLDQALEQAAEDRPSIPLYTGTTGVGWTLAYLERHLLDPDPEPSDVDALVDVALGTGKWREFDLIRGLTGAGVYQLERGRSLDSVVEGLIAISEEQPDGTTWWVDPATVLPERAEMFPQGYYDVGMAHGQAGVVALLAAGYTAGNESCGPLLRDSTRWLLAQRLAEGSGPGRYPLLFGKGDESPRGGRLAWCYGDAGVALGLLAAGTALEDDAILAEARETAYAAADRDASHTGTADASICHGAAGLALCFARLAHGFGGDERLVETTRFWANETLGHVVEGGPLGGIRYSVPREGDERGWEWRAGLLEGAAGVGLVLLALTTPNPPDWDVLFLARPVR